MGKENDATTFIGKVNQGIHEFGVRQKQRENAIKSEIRSRKLSEKAQPRQNSEKISQTEQEFTDLGVVDALERVIEHNIIYLSKKYSKNYQPIYDKSGLCVGSKEVEIPQITPSYIEYGENSVSLVVKEHWTVNQGQDDYGCHLTGTDSIDIVKLEDNKYEIYLRQKYEDGLSVLIKPSIVGKTEVLNSLAKIITVYKELSTIHDQEHSSFYFGPKDRELFPKFP